MSLDVEQHARQQDTARREATALRAALSTAHREADRLRAQLGLIEKVERHGQVTRPDWLLPRPSPKGHHRATLCLLLTDTHFDEVVLPGEVDGLNAYNRAIAEMRLRRVVERTVRLARHYLSGVTYDGITVMLGGDLFSGNIHEELARTNADTLFGSLLHWLGPMEAALLLLADEFRRVHVVSVPGNHGRMTRKPIAKRRAADNLDWLFATMLRRGLAKDVRLTWHIPAAADAQFSIYATRYLLTHGDQFRGGSGISGAMAPLLLGAHRKTRRQATAGKPYDVMVMGHWHQHLALPSKGLLVGPCLKGYDEYAYVSNFEPEPPAQALWLTTPERGITFSVAVQVADRKAEGW